MHRQVLELRKKVLGPEHPDMLMSMNSLAVLLDSQGNKCGGGDVPAGTGAKGEDTRP
jgi:hypothetical protein